MAITIKTLGAGTLRTAAGAFAGPNVPRDVILYSAPRPGEFGAIASKAALVTAMRFFNSSLTSTVQMHLRYVAYDMQTAFVFRKRRHILPLDMRLNPGELMVETTPLVLEAGDGLIGYAFTDNLINYVISGVERDV